MEQQQMVEMQLQQVGASIGMGLIIGYLVIYLFMVYCLAELARKLGMPFGKAFIWALIPIANIFLFLKLAQKPMWWFILLLIPIVNFVIMILAWMAIAERRKRPAWWGVMICLVPFANLIFFLMLVFGKEGTAAPAPAR